MKIKHGIKASTYRKSCLLCSIGHAQNMIKHFSRTKEAISNTANFEYHVAYCVNSEEMLNSSEDMIINQDSQKVLELNGQNTNILRLHG